MILRALAVGVIAMGVVALYPFSKIMLLFTVIGGASCGSVLPLIIILARKVPSRIHLGMKLALIVGGSWGSASILLLASSVFLVEWSARAVLLLIGGIYLSAWAAATLLNRSIGEKFRKKINFILFGGKKTDLAVNSRAIGENVLLQCELEKAENNSTSGR